MEVSAKETLPSIKAVSEVNSEEREDAELDRKKKKARTTFTGRQIFELEKQFEIKKYLSSSERADMAKLLNVTETQVCSINYHIFDNIFSLSLFIFLIHTFWYYIGDIPHQTSIS